MNLNMHGTGDVFQFGTRVVGSIVKYLFHAVVYIGPKFSRHCSCDGSEGREHDIDNDRVQPKMYPTISFSGMY